MSRSSRGKRSQRAKMGIKAFRRPAMVQDLVELAVEIAPSDHQAALHFEWEVYSSFNTIRKGYGSEGMRCLKNDPELSDVQVYPIVGSPARIFYREVSEGFEILRVLHKRNLEGILD